MFVCLFVGWLVCLFKVYNKRQSTGIPKYEPFCGYSTSEKDFGQTFILNCYFLQCLKYLQNYKYSQNEFAKFLRNYKWQ